MEHALFNFPTQPTVMNSDVSCKWYFSSKVVELALYPNSNYSSGVTGQ